MGHRLIGAALASALAVSIAQATPAQPGIDRSMALKAPVKDLARAALLGIAGRLTEVERPTFTGMSGPHAKLRGLMFATAAESAGNPGLCKATVVSINTYGRGGPVYSMPVYKVVGDLKPLPDMWNDAYGAQLSRKCAASGRVIRQGSGSFGQVTFFNVSNEDHVWLAARALQIAIENAKSGASADCTPIRGAHASDFRKIAPNDPEAVEDRENREVCAHAAKTLASLSLRRLMRLDVERCPETPRAYCVSAYLLRFAIFNHQALWRVTLQYEEGKGDNRDAENVRAVALRPDFAVYD